MVHAPTTGMLSFSRCRAARVDAMDAESGRRRAGKTVGGAGSMRSGRVHRPRRALIGAIVWYNSKKDLRAQPERGHKLIAEMSDTIIERSQRLLRCGHRGVSLTVAGRPICASDDSEPQVLNLRSTRADLTASRSPLSISAKMTAASHDQPRLDRLQRGGREHLGSAPKGAF